MVHTLRRSTSNISNDFKELSSAIIPNLWHFGNLFECKSNSKSELNSKGIWNPINASKVVP